jgi:hypothetical protein
MELSRRERDAGIKPDPEIDAFMKAIALSGQKSSFVTDYVLKVYIYVLAFNFSLLILVLPLCFYFRVYLD